MTTTIQKLFSDNLCPVCLNRHPGLCIPSRDPLPEPETSSCVYLSGNGRSLGTFVKVAVEPIVYMTANGEFKTIANDGVLDQLIKEKEEEEEEDSNNNDYGDYYLDDQDKYIRISPEEYSHPTEDLEPAVYLCGGGSLTPGTFRSSMELAILLDKMVKEKEEEEEDANLCIYCHYELPTGLHGCCSSECSTYYHNYNNGYEFN